MKPVRVQLSRMKGWRMPANTVKVDRSTPWGNPFIVGPDGNQATCLYHYSLLMGGLICLSTGNWEKQEAASKAIRDEGPRYPSLRGKNLGCWCRIGTACHADLLILIVNSRKRLSIDADRFLERYGWAMRNGIAVRLETAA